MAVLIDGLDHCRALILRQLLSFELNRQIFISRPLRLFFSFSVAFSFSLFLSLTAPAVLLVLGPLFFGMIHTFSSLRYFPKAITPHTGDQRLFSRLAIVVVFVAGLLRLLPTTSAAGSSIWEMCVLALLITIIGFRISFLASLSLLPLAICALTFPIYTAAILMVGHNFIAFFYWIKMSRFRAEQMTALFALLLFSLIHVGFILGAFDSAMLSLQPIVPVFFRDFSLLSIAIQVFPGVQNPIWFERAIGLFAFGQSIHYFVWIKAIPEQSIGQKIPLTFKQSRSEVLTDFGRPIALFAISTVLLFLILPLSTSAVIARDAYVALVSAHGYAEIAGLPFFFVKRV